MSSAISSAPRWSDCADGEGLLAILADAPASCNLVSTRRFSFCRSWAGVEEKARADGAAMHRGVEGRVRCWKRHWRRIGCACDCVIRRGIFVDMLGVVARVRRIGDVTKVHDGSNDSRSTGHISGSLAFKVQGCSFSITYVEFRAIHKQFSKFVIIITSSRLLLLTELRHTCSYYSYTVSYQINQFSNPSAPFFYTSYVLQAFREIKAGWVLFTARRMTPSVYAPQKIDNAVSMQANVVHRRKSDKT